MFPCRRQEAPQGALGIRMAGGAASQRAMPDPGLHASSDRCFRSHRTMVALHGAAMTSNTIVWFDIPVSDIDRAIAFYASVIGAAVHKESFPDGGAIGVLPHTDG